MPRLPSMTLADYLCTVSTLVSPALAPNVSCQRAFEPLSFNAHQHVSHACTLDICPLFSKVPTALSLSCQQGRVEPLAPK
jgi:hypothetical protein